jgi:hypothetical protein
MGMSEGYRSKLKKPPAAEAGIIRVTT